MICFKEGKTIKKKLFAIVTVCCAFTLALMLVACGGSSSGNASSASSSENVTAKQATETKAALDEGLGYWFGTSTAGYDKEKARAAFQKAADGGNAEGWYWLGTLMQCDTSTDRWPQVTEYYQKAVDNGCAKGWFGLGRLYETGYGVAKNVAKAKEFFEKAIGAGGRIGNIGLGYLHQKGEGVEASGAAAADWCNRALASQGRMTRMPSNTPTVCSSSLQTNRRRAIPCCPSWQSKT